MKTTKFYNSPVKVFTRLLIAAVFTLFFCSDMLAQIHSREPKFIHRDSIEFIKKIIEKVAIANLNNQEQQLPDLDKDASLAMYLIFSFEYKVGDKISEDVLAILFKAYDFTLTCVSSEWLDEKLDIVNPKEVVKLFNEQFSKEELYAFNKM